MEKEEIQAIRIKLGWTREQLAIELGYSADAVQSWELGNRRPHPTVIKQLERLQKRIKKE
jgi:DNA-binding transcriptional regulator YiaG